MRYLYLAFVCVIFVLPLVSQTKTKKAEIIWGKENKIPKKLTLSGIIGYDEMAVFALKKSTSFFRNSKFYLDRLDNQMNKVRSVELNLSDEKGREKYQEDIHYMNGQILLFSSLVDQKQKRNYLYCQTVDKFALVPNKDIKKIAEIEMTKNSRFNTGAFDFKTSPDSTKFMVYYNLPYSKDENEKIGFHIFDNQMNELWSKPVTLPYKDALLAIEDFRLDNEGNIYLLSRLYKDVVKEKRKGVPNYSYLILEFRKGEENFIEYPVNVDGKFFTDMQIAVNEGTNEIICAGFYSDEGTVSIKGSYYLSVNKALKTIKRESFNEFGLDFITQNMTEKKAQKIRKKSEKGKNVEMYEYDLDELIKKEDGGAFLVGEQYYMKVVHNTYTDANGNTRSTTTYYYYYNDIIVISIGPEGDIEWTKKVPKRQVTRNDYGYYSSYALAVVKDKLYFIFNDHPKNLYETQPGKIHNFSLRKEALTVLVEMDKDGNFEKEALFSEKNARVIVRPKVCEQINRNSVILYAERGKNEKYAKVTIKD